MSNPPVLHSASDEGGSIHESINPPDAAVASINRCSYVHLRSLIFAGPASTGVQFPVPPPRRSGSGHPPSAPGTEGYRRVRKATEGYGNIFERAPLQNHMKRHPVSGPHLATRASLMGQLNSGGLGKIQYQQDRPPAHQAKSRQIKPEPPRHEQSILTYFDLF